MLASLPRSPRDFADGAERVTPGVPTAYPPQGIRDSFGFCLSKNLIGVGWSVDTEERYVSWRTYCELQGKVNPSVQLLHDIENGSLVWTRDHAGRYYIAKVVSHWKYLNTWASTAVDIENVRSARYVEVGVESVVPGKVVNGFIPPLTMQVVKDKAARLYTAYLFATLAGEEPPAWRPTLDEVLDTYLTSNDLEDLVIVYLRHSRGYLVTPQRGKSNNTIAYEYVLRHPKDGHEAVAQVKAGRSPIRCDAGALPTGTVARAFVFSPTRSYEGEVADGVEQLERDDLLHFMRTQRWALPKLVEYWVAFAED